MKFKYVGLVTVGLSLGLVTTVGVQSTDVQAATPTSYYPITAQQTVSYVVQIDQSNRSDGLFANGPYRTSVETSHPIASAKTRNQQYATAVATAQTPTGNWVKIQFLDDTQAWIDLRGIKQITVNSISDQRSVNKTATLNQSKRNDGLFMDGPYRTSAATMKPATQAKTLNGQSVSVITTATVANVSWDQIRLQDGKTYWIDARGLSMINLNAVSDQQTVNQNAVLSQTQRSDGLFSDGPYKSSLTTLKPTASAKAHNGQAVKVVATAQSGGHQWSQITFNQSTYWIDSAGLSLINLYPVSDYQSVNRDAVLTQSKRNDGLFQAGPYKTTLSSLKPNLTAKQYNGQGVHVVATEQALGTTWAQIQLNGQSYWIDARGLQFITLYPITSQSALNNTRAIVSQSSRSDGLFANGPYRSALNITAPAASAKSLNGQVVEVIGRAETAIGSWRHIKTSTGKTYWIDNRGLTATNYYMVSNLKAASGYVQLIQSTRNDGLFANGPYKTSSNTLKANASGRSYNGQNATLLATAATETGNWVKLQLLNSNKIYWIDARGVKNIASPMTRVLNVPNYNQYKEGAPVGCEGTSLYEALRYKGYVKNYSLHNFLNTIPKASSPYSGFVGSPFIADNNTYTAIFSAPLAKWGSKFGKVYNISGASVQDIAKQVLAGNPIVAYVTVHFAGVRWGTWSFGRVPNNNHAVAVAGVDLTKKQFYLSDPIDGKYWISMSKFASIYNVRKMAIVVK
jgi:uncharacterized protein YvpB